MSKKFFQEGLGYFKLAKYNEAIEKFTLAIEALKESDTNAYLIHDTRSAAYAKLGNTKSALIDARRTIQIAPDRWQGYARAARLFLAVDKIDSSLSMINFAFQRLRDDEEERRASFVVLQKEVEARQLVLERRQKRLMNHISTLPVELLTEVFQLLTSEDPAALIPLLHVCNHWRQVIKFNPHFWSTLILSRRRPKDKAVQWIKYSQGRIRELKVKSGLASISGWPSESLRGIRWDLLRKCELHQWNIASYLHSISQSGAISNLTSLYIDSDPYEANFDTAFVFTANPHLQHLTLHDVSLRNVNPQEDIKLSELVSITFNNCDFDGQLLYYLLSTNPNLQSLQIEFPRIKDLQVGDGLPTIVLPKLTTIHLKCVRTLIFSFIDSPAMRVLRLHEIATGSMMVQLLAWSSIGLNLTELCLNGTPIQLHVLRNILRTSPDLQKLEICRRDNLINDILVDLCTPIAQTAIGGTAIPETPESRLRETGGLGVPVLCPVLTEVNFSHCKDVRTGLLVKFIKSRHPDFMKQEGVVDGGVVKPVQTLVIDGCDLVEPQWIEWMRTKVPRVSCIYMKKNVKFR